MNILLIEPDKILGAAIQTAFRAFGYDVSWKRSAQTALDSLDDKIPDLIILEIQIGLHNGIEFLYEIRSYTEWQHIPAIVHTINTKATDEIFGPALAQLGVLAVLYKLQTSTAQLVGSVKRLAPVT